MGWPPRPHGDNIVVNADRVFLHCYRASTSMSGSSQYGYVRGAYGNNRCKGKGAGKEDERSGYLFLQNLVLLRLLPRRLGMRHTPTIPRPITPRQLLTLKNGWHAGRVDGFRVAVRKKKLNRNDTI